MKQLHIPVIIILFSFLVPSMHVLAQTPSAPKKLVYKVPCIIEGNDTMPYFSLPEVYVYPSMTFKSKRQERFYWRTVRDVKKVLPLAHYIRQVVVQTNDTLMKMHTQKERDKYMKHFEKTLYASQEARFKKLTYNQGKLLIRMVDREFDLTSYDLIKAYRGRFRAGFYQVFAKLFGADLKATFGSNKNDKMVEQIIVLVENGQL